MEDNTARRYKVTIKSPAGQVLDETCFAKFSDAKARAASPMFARRVALGLRVSIKDRVRSMIVFRVN